MTGRSWCDRRRAVPIASIVAALAFSAPAAAREAVVLTPTFADRDLSRANTSGKPVVAVCSVTFVELTDERRFPDIVGVIGTRAIKSPPDREAWLRAVLTGLAARGVSPQFGANADPQSAATANVRLQLAGINASVNTYTANVVIQVEAKRSNGHALSRVYRGRSARTAFWSGGSETMQSVIDGAFAAALNAIAPDLKQLCRA